MNWRAALAGERPPRLIAVATVVAVVLGVAVVSAVVGVPAAPVAPPPVSASTIAPMGARSASAFCAGPTGTTLSSTDFVTNTTGGPVRGTVTATAAGAGTASVRRLEVPAHGAVAVDPGAGLPAGSHAAAFSFAGGGVSVAQAVSGPAGWSIAACPTAVSNHWYFPSGSTASGRVDLALFNPTTTAAMADVVFLTAGGPVAPQPFQGVVVPPGQLVEEDVGTYAIGLDEVATDVSVVSGALVAEEVAQWAPGPPAGVSLEAGSTRAAGSWYFAATTVVPGATVSFDVANPSPAPVTLSIAATLPSATVVPRRLTVSGSSTATFSPSSTPGWPRQAPFAVSVQAAAPVVVGRRVTVGGAGSAGAGCTVGIPGAARRWLVPGLGSPEGTATAGAALRSVSVANPGDRPARVVVRSLTGATRGTLVVSPGEPVQLSPGELPGLAPYVVSAGQPVVVEQDDGPSAAPGVVAWTGVPFP